jgi:hypothetical protein
MSNRNINVDDDDSTSELSTPPNERMQKSDIQRELEAALFHNDSDNNNDDQSEISDDYQRKSRPLHQIKQDQD